MERILVLGSAALKIGEAGEFDYSGSQAIKALKDSGMKTILVNPNIATVQTDPDMADVVYFMPINPFFIEKIIQKEKPDGILLGFGGQTALNCGIKLYQTQVLKKYNVQVLGTSIEAIINTEDRQIFVDKLKQIDVKTPKSVSVSYVKQAVEAANKIGYPVMIRIAYALGGLGSKIINTQEELVDSVTLALSHSEQVLIEEYLNGWKEIEYEVVRDNYDNCITVCNMENMDPLGIHTGESIVVAPSQTLSNDEYHYLREVAIKTIRHLNIIGECNIQYAVSPQSGEYRVIEVNARLSRSSALASKATGYPLAYVAAKIALGYSLGEITNLVTKTTMSCFEPALDYIVVKIPRWDLNKFPMVSKKLGSSMKSVGEVAAIGRCFEEALQKAIRMLDVGALGITANADDFIKNKSADDIEFELTNPTDERIFLIAKALEMGMDIEKLYQLTKIDKWYLHKIKNIVEMAAKLTPYKNGPCPREIMLSAKKMGFSDRQLANIFNSNEDKVRMNRVNFGIRPYCKKIDTLAGEYPAQTNYIYLTYNASEDDVDFYSQKTKVLTLGSGAYRIGSSVEFDWCCVNTVKVLKKMNYFTLMLNFNPETVSTDYDIVDRLYFDEISLETILEIAVKENFEGAVVSMGGQIPNNLALTLHKFGIKIFGTAPEQIDRAEDRKKFSAALDQIEVDQPEWKELVDLKSTVDFANKVGYPVLIRPSYILSGASMSVASNDTELKAYLSKAVLMSKKHPVVVSKFIEDAKELELDAVSFDGDLTLFAISEHIENAGVHSGDATLIYPAQRTYVETMRLIIDIGKKIAKQFNICGPFNVQFIAKNNFLKVIECNLRASRSFPFISKISKTNFIKEATLAIMGEKPQHSMQLLSNINYLGVKASQFSFTRLSGADPTLGVEMSSTGEVGCLGHNFNEALLSAFMAVGFKFPIKKVLLSTGPLEKKIAFIHAVKNLQAANIDIYSTPGTFRFLKEHNIPSIKVNWPNKHKAPDVLDFIDNEKPDLVVNIPKSFNRQELDNDYLIRRHAVDHGIPLVTNIQLAKRLVDAFLNTPIEKIRVQSWQSY